MAPCSQPGSIGGRLRLRDDRTTRATRGDPAYPLPGLLVATTSIWIAPREIKTATSEILLRDMQQLRYGPVPGIRSFLQGGRDRQLRPRRGKARALGLGRLAAGCRARSAPRRAPLKSHHAPPVAH